MLTTPNLSAINITCSMPLHILTFLPEEQELTEHANSNLKVSTLTMKNAVLHNLSQKISLQCLQHIYMKNKVVELCYKE